MQTDLNDFINNRKWTNFNYKTEEKIEGSISILVKDRPSQEDFKADYISIQLRRPVYNSSYTTTMLNSQETDYFFKYVEGAPLEFEENTYKISRMPRKWPVKQIYPVLRPVMKLMKI